MYNKLKTITNIQSVILVTKKGETLSGATVQMIKDYKEFLNIESPEHQMELFTCIYTHCDYSDENFEVNDLCIMDIIKDNEYPGFDNKYDVNDTDYAVLGHKNIDEIRDTIYKFYHEDTAKQTQLIIDNTGVQFKQLIPVDMQPKSKIQKGTKDEYPFYLKLQTLMLDQTAAWVSKNVRQNKRLDVNRIKILDEYMVKFVPLLEDAYHQISKQIGNQLFVSDKNSDFVKFVTA